jgi:two-component system response regulator HydG
MPLEDRPRLHLLVMDEDAEVRGACVEVARRMGFTVAHAMDPASAYAIVRTQKVDVMLLDLRGTESRTRGASGAAGGGMSLLEELRSLHPEIAVVVTTSSGTVASAVDAMRLGAEDYLTKPFALDELVRVLERTSRKTHANQESRMLRERLRNQRGGGPLVGRSPEMEKLYRILSKVAHSTHPVLILGESGTGKELVARSIHFNGPLASKPFVPVDCGSLAPELIEGELFGYVRGAAPVAAGGALAGPRDGLLASADGGTVFLDEIGELPLDLQAKLLRALQERAVYPLGGTHSVPISARVLAATNQELTAMVDQGKFRRDLYFRLNVVSLRIPPLRQRREDIPDLTEYFLEKLRKDSGAKYTFSDEALRVLAAYDWPGNVRELESVVERACAMSSGPVLHVMDLASPLQQVAATMRADQNPVDEDEEVLQAHSRIQPIAEMERRAILGTIRQLKGDKLLAAKLLGIGKTTLYRKLKEYGIDEWSESGLRS